MKIGDFIGNTEITAEFLADLRTEKEKRDLYEWLDQEEIRALHVKYGLIPDPDDGFTSKQIRELKRKRARFIEFIKLILDEDELLKAQERFPEAFSLKDSRLLCRLPVYPETSLETPWLQVVDS